MLLESLVSSCMAQKLHGFELTFVGDVVGYSSPDYGIGGHPMFGDEPSA